MDAEAGIAHPVIVLAAGRSSRLGSPKGLVDVQGQPWLCAQLERLGACRAPSAVVVLGLDREEYARAIAWITRASEDWFLFAGVRVRVVRNPAPDRGPFSSLLCALDALDAAGGAFVLPIDVPCPGRPVWRALQDAAVSDGIDAAVPVHGARGGHPVLCSARLLARMRVVPLDAPDARLDAQLRALPDPACARVPVDDVRVTLNLNRPEDWESVTGGS